MGIDRPVYCTREDVKNALDVAETARANGQVDRAVQAAADSVEGLCHRCFYPVIATRYFDWPDQYARPWRLWLDDSEVISVTALSSGGTVFGTSEYLLEPNRTGPPYNRIEINRGTNAGFGGGSSPQRDITVTGLWGYTNTESPAGTVTLAANSTITTLDVSDSSAIGVGQIIRVGDERMLVSERAMITTSQTLQAPLTAHKNDQAVTVTTGSAYAVGEVLLLDTERMRIVDITGNQLIVDRAWDGSTLATHAGSTIYASRRLTVVRGALGTTAASISLNAAVVAWQPPAAVRELAIAEAVVDLLQQSSGYARTTGVGSSARQVGGGTVAKTEYGVGIGDLRDRTYTSHGRKVRKRAV